MKRQLRRLIIWPLVMLILMHPGLALSTEIVVDTHAPAAYQPDLIIAPNDTTIINISTPSAGGVSRNLFSDYNVGPSGLILNNSTDLALSELGGYLFANPNLSHGSARLILNEVTGSNPTRLNGYTEIAGASADLIVANPNGISINGGGFINTPRVTLTTGVGELQNDSFAGILVEQGTISINGVGFDAANIDSLDLYARAISINADLWAKHLNIVTGRNRISAEGSIITKLTEETVAAPLMALDSTVLGGMYADHISLLGTETGVGVHLAGDMAASGSDIRLTTDGRLEISGQLLGKKDVHLNANEIALSTSGQVLSGQDIRITSTTLLNEGNMISANNATYSIAESLTNRDGRLFAFNNMSIYGVDSESAVDTLLNDSGQIETWQGDLNIFADELTNRSKIPIIEQTSYLDATDWFYLTSERRTQTVTEGYRESLVFQDPTPALISSGPDLQIQATDLTNLHGTISASNNLTLAGHVLKNSGTDLIHEWTTTVNEHLWRMKHTKYHTACKKTWQPNPPVIDGPYAEIIGSVPSVINAGGDLTAIFETEIGNGEQRSSILLDPSPLPDDLTLSVQDNVSTVTFNEGLSGLFQTAADDRPYIIETRPLFADKTTFVNSDYLLGQINIDPEATMKRLGDGFYETIMVRDAIRQQTGNRFLDPKATSDFDQYTRLMDAAAAAAQELELAIGVALNQEQIASLSHDIVWFVAQEVDGQQVLVPQLYLAQLQKDNLSQGSQIVASGNVSLLTSGTICTSGEISAGNDLNMMAANDIQVEEGELSSGNMTLLVTGGNIIIDGGRVRGESVTLQADEEINIQSRHREELNESGFNTVVGRTAGVNAATDVTLQSKEIQLTGATMKGGTVDLSAKDHLTVTSIAKNSESSIDSPSNFSSRIETEQIGSSIKGDNVFLSSEDNLTLVGSRVEAQQNARLIAGADLTIVSAEEQTRTQTVSTSNILFNRSKSENISETIQQKESIITTGGDLELYAGINASDGYGGDLTLGGSHLAADNNLTLYADGDVLIAATDELTFTSSSTRKSNVLSNRQDRTSSTEISLKQSELSAGNDLQVRSGSDIGLVASSVISGGDSFLVAGKNGTGNLNLIAGDATRIDTFYHRKSGIDLGISDNFFSFATVEKNSRETATTSSITSTISSEGSTILLAENDVNLIGAEVSASVSLIVESERDVNILAAAESSSERTVKDEKKVGVAIDSDKDKVDVFFGVQSERDVSAEEQKLTAGSSLVAGGTVAINANRNLSLVGSNLAAGQDLLMAAGEFVNVLANEEESTVSNYHQLLRVGFSTSYQHNIGSTVETVQSVGDSSNALTGASRTLKSVDAIDRATQPSVELHFGVSGSQSKSEQTAQTISASSLYAGQDLNIDAGSDLTLDGTLITAERNMSLAGENVRLLATNSASSTASDSSSYKAGVTIQASKSSASITGGLDGSKSAADTLNGIATPVQIAVGENLAIDANSDLEIEGSQISVGNDIMLNAGTLNIHAAESNSDLLSNSHQFGAGFGVSASYKGQQPETGFVANINGGQDRLSREGSDYLNAHIDAGNLIELSVQGDAQIKGTTLSGEAIHADIDGNLMIASVRDKAEADGDRWNARVSYSGIGSSGISIGQGQTDGHKDWIDEQTSLIARDRVDLYVGGHTELDAAIISSETGNLKLDTNTFAFSDHSGIDSEVSYDVSVGVNSAGGGPANAVSGAGVDNKKVSGSLDAGYRSYEKLQEARATIGTGEIIVRSDLASGIDSTEGLNRDLDLAYEITKDESSDYELYASTGSIDRISNPIDTSKEWVSSAKNYGHTAVEAIKGLDQITKENSTAKYFVEKLDPFILGIAPTRKNHGGLFVQLLNLPAIQDKQKTAFQLYPKEHLYVQEHPKLFEDPENVPYYDKLTDKDKARYKGKVISKYPVEITEENATYQNFGNGMLNTLLEAGANGMQQTGSEIFTIAYNPSHGLIGDLLESGIDKLFGNEWIHTAQAEQTGYFTEDVIKARGNSGSNFVTHSQANLLLNAGLSVLPEDTFDSLNVDSNRITIFTNGSPVTNETLSNNIQFHGFRFTGSNVNSGDAVGETLGGNSGLVLFAGQSPSTGKLNLYQRASSAVMNGPILFTGDKYPRFDSTGKLINSISPHSSYSCIVNCGPTSPWEKP